MKSHYLLIFVFLITACSSSSDDNSSDNDDSAFHPPAWIHGTWSFDEQTEIGYVFTGSTFCSILGTQQNCFPSQESEGYHVDEEISDTDYKFTIIQSAMGQVIQTSSYHFIKIDNDQIYFDDPIMGNRTMYILD